MDKTFFFNLSDVYDIDKKKNSSNILNKNMSKNYFVSVTL